MASSSLVFVQISDLHFREHRAGEAYDRDADLRNEILRDAHSVCEPLAPVAGVWVCGDVAYSGQPAEYELAVPWFDDLCNALACKSSRVWVVPGNHDIDRATLGQSWVLRSVREKLRTCRIEDIDVEIERCVEDAIAADVLLQPLANYNAFAARYSCDIDARTLRWSHDFPLSDDWTLQLWGVTSPIVSDNHDDVDANKLVVGASQVAFPNDDGIVHAVMCHHPPQWLRDNDDVTDRLNTRVLLQLFGHKHRQRVYEISQGGRRSLQLASGAAHPDREEARWEPRYNVIALTMDVEGSSPALVVDVYGRRWNSATGTFTADASSDRSGERFRLPVAVAPRPRARVATQPASGDGESRIMKEGPSEVPVLDIRQLTYRFLGLPFTRQIEIAQRLSLLHDEDEGVGEAELRRRIFQRAAEAGRIDELWRAVEQHASATERTL